MRIVEVPFFNSSKDMRTPLLFHSVLLVQGAGFKKFGDVPGGNAGKIGVVGELPAEYNVNNLDLEYSVSRNRLQERCATWANAIPTGQQGRSVLQSFAWVE